MADYFTNFSFTVPLANAQQLAIALDLFRKMSSIQQGDGAPAEFPSALKEFADDCVFEAEAGRNANELWLHSDCGGVDAVCEFVHHLLKLFHSETVVTFEWSYDCNKPRTDAFGGGAAIITAAEIKFITTSDWIREQTQPAVLQPST